MTTSNNYLRNKKKI